MRVAVCLVGPLLVAACLKPNPAYDEDMTDTASMTGATTSTSGSTAVDAGVVTTAAGTTAIDTEATASGPPDPSTGEPGDGSTGLSSAFLVLSATKHYGVAVVDGDVALAQLTTLQLPDRLDVIVGNAGNHLTTLTYYDGPVPVVCTYKGGSSQTHPNSEAELQLGLFYNFLDCAGVQGLPPAVSADRVVLHIDNGDSEQPPGDPKTVVEAKLQIIG